MSLDLLVGGELPPDDARALAAGTSGPCPLTVHRPGNRLGLEVGSVVRFTPTEPPYGRAPTATTPGMSGATSPATAATATVTIDTAVTAFIYLGPHVDSAGNLVGAGCRFTGRGVIPNASEWLVQLPDGTSLTYRATSRPVQGLTATFGAG
ncbi:hypothetical protein [Terrabacter sp. C0L_2]|jgi:hypothetical protein|uniref:hypothetical protein n=1 Tax=Terrabacter sp. C0L_2 TaxID=3108389 RepID=UPI002ED1EB02|nr:hypothetical protein U5C87_22065 [Terrabacter sp. C0L_2]